MSNITPLAETQIGRSDHDTVEITLVEPDDMPVFVQVTWPEMPTVIDPARFRDAAAAMVKLFSDAHIALARLKAYGA
jgi:hypothetical protein